MSSIPTYPNDVIATYKQLVDVKLALSDLPIFRQSRTYATANESIYSETTNIGKAAQFEFGIHGLFHYSTNFYEERSGQVVLRYSLAETHSIFMICQLLKAAEYFYEAIDYQGLVDLRVGLRSRPESTRLGHSNISIVDGQFFVGVRRLAHAINSVETASTLCKDFLWSAGAGPSAQVTDTFDKEITSAFNECAKTVLY